MKIVKIVSIITASILVITLIVLSILGTKERVGYIEVLEELDVHLERNFWTGDSFTNGINEKEKIVLFTGTDINKIILNNASFLRAGDETLDINKVVMWSDPHVYLKTDGDLKKFEHPDEIYALDKNIELIKKIYRVRIRYNSKVFKNSDIYEVLPILDNNDNKLKNIKFDKEGSPYGYLVYNEDLTNWDNIGDISYVLKVKDNILKIFIIIIIISVILLSISFRNSMLENIRNAQRSKLLTLVRKKYSSILLFTILFIISFIVLNTYKPMYLPFNVALISNNADENSKALSMRWDSGYGFNDRQEHIFANNSITSYSFSNIYSYETNNSFLEISGIDNENIDFTSEVQQHYPNIYRFNIINNEWSKPQYRAYIHFSGTNEQKVKIKLNAKEDMFERTVKAGGLLYILASKTDENIYSIDIVVSSAIFESRTVGYTKRWLAETTDNSIYSTLFFRSGYEPVLINGIGTGSILFENFQNPFYETISSKNIFTKGIKVRVLALVLASIFWTLIIFSIIKCIFSKTFRNYFLQLKTLHLYIAYFFSLWAIFLLFGNYLGDVQQYVPRIFMLSQDNYIIRNIFSEIFFILFTNYFAGAKAMCLMFVIPYAFISVFIFYILKYSIKNKYICFFIPLLMLLVPSFNLAFVNIFLRFKEAALWWVLSCLSTFWAFYYLKDKKQNIVMIFSILAAVISVLHRFDFIVILFVIALFWGLYKGANRFKKVLYSFYAFLLVIMVLLFTVKSGNESFGASGTLVNQYFFAYLHPKFYDENMFTREEVEELSLYKEYKNTSKTWLEIIAENYSFSDAHYLGYYLKWGKTPTTDKKMLISKILKNPYPVIYARFNTLFVTLIPKREWGSHSEIGHTRYYSKDKNILDYPIERKYSIHYSSFYKIYESIYGSKIVREFLLYGVGPLMVILMILSFIFWRKAPITALINIPGLLYLGVLFLINIAAGGWYYYGAYLVSILSIPLFFIEMRLKKDRE